jgi:hypothetical protein
MKYRLDIKRIVMTGPFLPCIALAAIATGPAWAHEITSASDAGKPQAFDITRAAATTDGRLATFMMEVAGTAGSVMPETAGRLEGAKVAAYVWPTGLDPAAVGFDAGSGTLALAITAHPDFDDTPLFDENGDGDPANDGAGWHAHWVVLVEDTGCGAGLKVRDVSPGQDALPATAPMLPIALDSPGMSPILSGSAVRITVPVAGAESVGFDAVTADLQVSEAGTAPLLCVTGVHDVASGDLSLPGRITKAE